MGSNCLCCSYLRSCGRSLCHFILSQEEGVRRKRRLIWGVIVLLIVDVIWVGSAELTDFIFKSEGFNKPFFTTYVKTSSFMVYLTGFLFYEPWRIHCKNCNDTANVSGSDVSQTGESSSLLGSSDSSPAPEPHMNEPTFEQMTDDERTSGVDMVSSNSYEIISKPRKVTFNNVREVRRLADHVGEQAWSARRPYQASQLPSHKLPLRKVAKVALIFCFLWFSANCSYQVAISNTSPAAVNILSSSSGLFTLILASIFQSSTSDKFSVTKLVAVLMSVTGIVLVTLADSRKKGDGISAGALWALASAFLYACYLTMIKHKVPNQKQMDIPMFFGLVGLFNFILLWPGFFILNYWKVEQFKLPPEPTVWGYITLNALIGTVLSEALWLWGCYLTSSLTATLSLVLILPLTMIVDVFMKRVHFSWMFFLGTIPVFLSFFAVSFLTHYGDWDPIWIGVKKLANSQRQLVIGILDAEQTESLRNASVHGEETTTEGMT